MGNITMKKILIASLVASAFVPVTFATPAFAEDYEAGDFCSSNNRNISFALTNLQEGEDSAELEGTRTAAGNVWGIYQAYSGEVTADCTATNTKSGTTVPGQSVTGVVIDEGGPVGDPYEVKVCQNTGQAPGTAVTSEGTALGFTQAQCEALTA
jgi:hypothetical protein